MERYGENRFNIPNVLSELRSAIKVSMWIYIFDEFKPLSIDTGMLLELANKDTLKLLETVRDVLNEYIKCIKLLSHLG